MHAAGRQQAKAGPRGPTPVSGWVRVRPLRLGTCGGLLTTESALPEQGSAPRCTTCSATWFPGANPSGPCCTNGRYSSRNAAPRPPAPAALRRRCRKPTSARSPSPLPLPPTYPRASCHGGRAGCGRPRLRRLNRKSVRQWAGGSTRRSVSGAGSPGVRCCLGPFACGGTLFARMAPSWLSGTFWCTVSGWRPVLDNPAGSVLTPRAVLSACCGRTGSQDPCL
jgi:hypothetical protein